MTPLQDRSAARAGEGVHRRRRVRGREADGGDGFGGELEDRPMGGGRAMQNGRELLARGGDGGGDGGRRADWKSAGKGMSPEQWESARSSPEFWLPITNALARCVTCWRRTKQALVGAGLALRKGREWRLTTVPFFRMTGGSGACALIDCFRPRAPIVSWRARLSRAYLAIRALLTLCRGIFLF